MDPYLEGIIIFAVVCSMLIGLLLLIRDMDNPFEIGSNTYADVDLETLNYLTTYFDEQDAEMEKGRASNTEVEAVIKILYLLFCPTVIDDPKKESGRAIRTLLRNNFL